MERDVVLTTVSGLGIYSERKQDFQVIKMGELNRVHCKSAIYSTKVVTQTGSAIAYFHNREPT